MISWKMFVCKAIQKLIGSSFRVESSGALKKNIIKLYADVLESVIKSVDGSSPVIDNQYYSVYLLKQKKSGTVDRIHLKLEIRN